MAIAPIVGIHAIGMGRMGRDILSWGIPLEIRYVGRSKFLNACEAMIRERQADLTAVSAISIRLEEPGGYDGRVIVTIDAMDRDYFRTDWEGNDATRFPARIKAAATALLNCGCPGRYEISHLAGTLTIIPL